MHRHPATRNLKRAQNTSRRNTRSVSRASVWSKEETELLIKLNERYKHLKQPNVALQEYFPDKTLKQINDKRNAPVHPFKSLKTWRNEWRKRNKTSFRLIYEESIYESATEDKRGGDIQQMTPNKLEGAVSPIYIIQLSRGRKLSLRCRRKNRSYSKRRNTNGQKREHLSTNIRRFPNKRHIK